LAKHINYDANKNPLHFLKVFLIIVKIIYYRLFKRCFCR